MCLLPHLVCPREIYQEQIHPTGVDQEKDHPGHTYV